MLTKKTRVSRRGRTKKEAAPEARKQPSQERSKETVAVILEAAARILEKDGLVGYNTNAIAQRAGVSIGSIYQYFPNKDALTLALIEKFEQELLQAARGAMNEGSNLDLLPALGLVIDRLFQVHRNRAALNRVLELEEDRLRHNLRDEDATKELLRTIVALLKPHRHLLKATVNMATIQDVLTISRAMIDAALLRDTPAAVAKKRILRAVAGYLLYDLPRGKTGGMITSSRARGRS